MVLTVLRIQASKGFAMSPAGHRGSDPGAWGHLAALQAIVDAGTLAARGRLTVQEVLRTLPSGTTLVVEAETHAALAADPAWCGLSVEARVAPLGLTHVGVLRGEGKEICIALRVIARRHRPRRKGTR